MRIEEKGSYPRPDFIRTDYISLCGEWDFAFDDDEKFNNCSLTPDRKITVPFPYQSTLSGVEDSSYHPVMWYERVFEIKENQKEKTALLKFGAVDHRADVWINGSYAGGHTGGYTPFTLDITDLLVSGENIITVKAEDRNDPSYLRGKQIWEGEPEGCFYTQVSGIWQEVWIEFTDGYYITSLSFNSDFDALRVDAELTFNKAVSGTVELKVEKENFDTFVMIQTVKGNKAKLTVNFADYGIKDNKKINWSPARPNLFDVKAVLKTDKGTADTVYGYFGFRKFEAKGNKLYLNNSQYFLRMVLNQGYWSDGIYRPENGEAYKKDIELALDCGFNGMRMHQKIEDPKFYYYADLLGMPVCAELPSFYEFTQSACGEALGTVTEFIARDKSHPCIIAWVIFNETWGLRKYIADAKEQAFAKSLYHLCKSLDGSRPVSTNDGWENPEETDVITVHDYRAFSEKMTAYYSDPAFLESGSARTGHPYMIPGEKYKGQPILITEYGGKRINEELFGEERSFKLIEEIRTDTQAILKIKDLCGYCYTQLTDVYQENNGIYDMNRNPKADIEEFKKIFSAKP